MIGLWIKWFTTEIRRDRLEGEEATEGEQIGQTEGFCEAVVEFGVGRAIDHAGESLEVGVYAGVKQCGALGPSAWR